MTIIAIGMVFGLAMMQYTHGQANDTNKFL